MAALAALPPVNRALFATVTRLLKDVVRFRPPNIAVAHGPDADANARFMAIGSARET